MQTEKIPIIPITAMLMLAVIGCGQNENRRLAEMAERHSQRQAEQNRRTTELQREVAAGTRRLVEADAKARKEMVTLQREIQAERSEVDRQRDALEGERRDLATQRHLNPIVAAAITNTGLLLACLLPLLICWFLLHSRVDPADDRAVAEILLEDLVAERPLLSQVNNRQAIGFDDNGTRRLSDDSERSGESP